jgi:hypothetical protein
MYYAAERTACQVCLENGSSLLYARPDLTLPLPLCVLSIKVPGPVIQQQTKQDEKDDGEKHVLYLVGATIASR